MDGAHLVSTAGRNRKAGLPEKCSICGKTIRRLVKHKNQQHSFHRVVARAAADARKMGEAMVKTGDAMRAFYERLAAAYEQHPTVPDLGGGVSGDLYPL